VKKTLFVITALLLYNRSGAAFSRILEYAKAAAEDKNTTVYLLSYFYPENMETEMTEVIPGVFICGSKTQSQPGGHFIAKNLRKQFDPRKRKQFVVNLERFIKNMEGVRSGLVFPSLLSYALEKDIIGMFRKNGLKVFSERNELKKGIGLNKAFPTNLFKKILFAINYPFMVMHFIRQDSLA
jgi:hypothetical protein